MNARHGPSRRGGVCVPPVPWHLCVPSVLVSVGLQLPRLELAPPPFTECRSAGCVSLASWWRQVFPEVAPKL